MKELHDGRNDFDFLIGTWNSRQRRLRERLKGSTSWEEFDARLVVRKILGGLGNTDELSMKRESGPAEGFAVRLYDIHSRQWSIYWADGRSSSLVLPEIGSFENGIGRFYAHEPFEGRYILSRYQWCDIKKDSCRWEQAFSEDAGLTWETNWTADFTRA